MIKAAGKPHTEPRTIHIKARRSGTAFQDMLQKDQEKHSRDRFDAMLLKMEDQAGRLARSGTARDLQDYKNLVADFLKTAVAFTLKREESRSGHRSGAEKVHQLVRKTDKELAALTEEVLTDQKGLSVMRRTGVIKGLLVNVYT
ncbi:YaaR family protein [Alteribacter lacisalsi]|nr:YaaR family protein [Alteribacter lacisalsi]